MERTSERMLPRLVGSLLALGVVTGVAAGGGMEGASSGEEGPPAAAPGAAMATYDEVLAGIDGRLAALSRRAERVPHSWSARESVATALQRRARLTGSYDDLARAEAALGEAFTVAPEGAGPFLARARLHFTLHRFERALADLARAEARPVIDEPTSGEIVGLRAEIAAERGRHDEARRGLHRSLIHHDGLAASFRLAHAHARVGHERRAAGYLRDVHRRARPLGPVPRAWVHLQEGLIDLDAGRLDAALAHYRDAGSILSGWWLVDEHVAEVLALRGETTEALRIYEDVIRRTGHPEMMDAAAALLFARGRDDEARALVERARREHERRIALFPEAAGGHAVDHFIEFGEIGGGAARAVELAEEETRRRPGEESYGRLGRALRAAGRVDDAGAAEETAAALGRRRARAWSGTDATAAITRSRETTR